MGGRTLLDEFDVSVDASRVVTIMGPSGCGKSSLLSFVCGTLDSNFEASGSITLNGRELVWEPPENRKVGILFQDDLLFPHLSVAENLQFALLEKIGKKQRMSIIQRTLGDLELEGTGNRDPASLSGGQRLRVALMRSLLAEPDALLLDEPFSKLDRNLRSRVRSMVFLRARKKKIPVLMVTHDHEDAESAGGSIIEWPV